MLSALGRCLGAAPDASFLSALKSLTCYSHSQMHHFHTHTASAPSNQTRSHSSSSLMALCTDIKSCRRRASLSSASRSACRASSALIPSTSSAVGCRGCTGGAAAEAEGTGLAQAHVPGTLLGGVTYWLVLARLLPSAFASERPVRSEAPSDSVLSGRVVLGGVMGAGGCTPSAGALAAMCSSAWCAHHCSTSFLLRPAAWWKCGLGGRMGKGARMRVGVGVGAGDDMALPSGRSPCSASSVHGFQQEHTAALEAHLEGALLQLHHSRVGALDGGARQAAKRGMGLPQ